jgi:TonB family protein
MRRTATVEVAVSLLLCGALMTTHAKQSNVSQNSLTQEKAQTFSGKIVSINAVRFVLRIDDNDVWYHLDDQQKASQFFGRDVWVTGTFDGLTGTIRVQSIVVAPPHQKPPANTQEMKQNSKPAKSAPAPPASTATAAPGAQQANPAQELAGNVPTPRSEGRTSPESETSHDSKGEMSVSPSRREAPLTSFLSLPEEPVSASSSVAISSRRLVPVPPNFNRQKQPPKNLLVGHLVKRVEPSYPQDARQQGIEGTVRLHAVVAADGKVESLERVTGPPLLVSAAVSAVREWRYSPTLLEGRRVQVQADIRLVFRLPD